MLFYVSKPAQDGSLDEKLIVAHRTQPLIATAWTAPTSVLVTDNEGEVLACVNEPAGCTPETSKGCVVTSLAWHPTERILTIGWNSGRLSTWSMPCITELGVKEDVADSNANIYSTPALIALSAKAATIADAEGAMKEHGEGAVKCLEWTVNGQYLLSTSMKNTAVMWVLENSVGTSTAPTVAHKLKPLWSVTTEGGEPIKTATNIPEGQWKGRSANAAVKEDNMSFLLTNDSNSIFFVNEEQKFGTCVTLEDRLVTMVYDPAKRQLVTLTNSGMIEIFQLGEDLTAKSTLRRKLSTPSSDKYSFTMAQVLPGVVAFSSGDDRVRVFDIKTEDMYMLTFPKEGAHVTTVVADHTKGLLAVGTEEGALVVFSTHVDSHRPENAAGGLGADAKKHLNSEDRAKLWEPRPIHELGDVINNIILSPMGDLAACVGGKQLQVLHESVRKRAWDGVAAATQISTEMVVIESVTGCQCLLKSKSKVRGLSIAFPNIALWNGSQIDLYTINEATSEFTLINFVPTTSPAFAVHQDGLLYVKDGHIIYSTLQLKQIAQMSFTETEGVPILLDIMNDFVVAVSSRNFLRLARLSPRDLRPSGPSRPLQLEEALQSLNLPESQRTGGQIIVSAARVNAQGRRVALMTKTGVFGVQDTRIWVYDSDNDKVVSYDFSQREEVPEAIYWNTPEPNAKPMGELEYLLLACETRERNRPPAIDTKGGDSSPSGDVLDAKESHNLRREDLPEALPDMENFGDAQGDDRGSAAALGAQATRGHNLVTLFSTRNDLVVHNSVSLKSYQICLVGLTIPDFLLASVKINGDPNKAEDYVIEQKRLRDFDGLKSDKDAAVREALMKFGYYSTIGNMDEAYRCIKTIKNPTAWQGLAKMCVSNGRLDVAAVCLATMQDGVAARALREAIEEYPNDKRIQMASLACSLSMLEECEQLLHEAKREDLITDVFLACGKFEQAQRHSEHFDRIRIRPVAYKYAQFMESLQNMDAAIMWYYNAKCAGTDVPRIYYQSRRRAELRELIMPSNTAQSNGQESDEPPATSGEAPAGEDAHGTFAALFPHNKDLLLWWAQHSERHRNLQEALRFYHAGKDVYNVVRLLCTMTPPKIDNAIELVNTEIERAKSKFLQQQATCVSGDPSIPTEPDPVGAAFFIGKHYENINELERALEYYKHAAAFRSAIRVSRRLNRYGEILHLALSSGDSRLMLDNAIFLEKKGAFDKAVEIFRKLNATQCALDGCIKGSLFDTLHEISTTLAQASSDPQVFLSMANHFQSIGNYQKAVEMLVFAKKFEDALQMCQERNVILTEEMADTMTVETPETTAEDRNQWLRRIAHIAKDQGSWTLACKKYTQSGERLKALKMLMRGGDVTKVIFFANHSRNAEIFTLAANFLQSQNWSTDATIYSSIISFYTKAKAFDNLMAFYDSCAQLQIDENRNYTEALSAVEECIRAVEKALANKINVSTTKLSIFKDRSKLLGGFVKAQQLVRSMNPDRAGSPAEKQIADEVIAICSDIIKRSRAGNPDHDLIETSLRVGDVFALLVKFYFEKMKEPKNALKVLESMPKHGVEPQYFLEMDMMEKVCSANGKKLSEVVVIGKDGALGGGSPGADDQPERDTDLLDDELR